MKQTLTQYVESLGLNYNAVFVPKSASRNAKEKDPSLNWKVTVSKNGRSITTDYMQGIGHAPGYQFSFKQNAWQPRYFAKVAEEGKFIRNISLSNGNVDYYEMHGAFDNWMRKSSLKPLPAPALNDILHSLVLDADALDYDSYEDWASNYGYEEDSRKGETIYRQCVQQAIQLRNMLGEKALQELREYLNEY